MLLIYDFITDICYNKTMSKYDLIFVGAGLFSATVAHEAVKKGKKCLVIEKRPHVAGNIYTEKVSDINVHKYLLL